MNQFVAMAVAEKISAMRSAEFFAGRGDAAGVEAALRIVRREGGSRRMATMRWTLSRAAGVWG